MKTSKFLTSLCYCSAFLVMSLTTANAQAVQVRPETWTGCLHVNCANNGAGDDICGTLEAHGLYRFNKDGILTGAHFNHLKSVFTSVTTGEKFKVYGVTNMKYNKIDDSSLEWVEMLVLSGEWGNKYLIKTIFHEVYDEYGNSVDFEMELYFDKCL
jgi:hypothetical protein